jgi:hypothetical protein
VRDLADPLRELLEELEERRELLEEAEDVAVVVTALASASIPDQEALATYDALFPKQAPSRTAALGFADETRACTRWLQELAVLPKAHPLAAAYADELDRAVSAMAVALRGPVLSPAAETPAARLALLRARLVRFKLEVDRGRLVTFEGLVERLPGAAAAEAFFVRTPVRERERRPP